jgi:hypothetical protein
MVLTKIYYVRASVNISAKEETNLGGFYYSEISESVVSTPSIFR